MEETDQQIRIGSGVNGGKPDRAKPTAPQLQGKREVPIDFVCDIEAFDREQYQRDGHFICGSFEDQTDGTQPPHKWEGPLVYVLTLRHMDQRDEGGDAGMVVLRVMSDSPERVEHDMERAIRGHITTYAMLLASRTAADGTYAQLIKDHEALKSKFDAHQGAGEAARVITEARIREIVG